MKKKFSIMAMLSLLLVVVAASPAYAITGFADDSNNAFPMSKGSVSTAYIDSINDVDWFSYTNNSGVDQGLVLSLQSPAGINLDFAVVWYHAASGTLTVHNPTDFGAGAIDAMGVVTGAGDNLKFIVRSHGANDYGYNQLYHFKIE